MKIILVSMLLAAAVTAEAAVVAENENLKCDAPSVTTASGTYAPKGTICPGDLIFEETFDKFDLRKWQHEQTLGGGGNWEFEWYTNNRSVSYVENGVLHIKPNLLAEYSGDPNFVYSGHLDINGGSPADRCTNPAFYGCVRDGNANSALNPVVSARIRTLYSFSFKYGKIEVRAKNPAGDWLWPAIWMLPTDNQYAGWPSSGEIDIMESRGNRNLIQNGRNIGTQLSSSTLHWGTSSVNNFYMKTHYENENPAGYDTAFHKYQMEWTPDHITFSIDDVAIGTVTPPAGGFWEMSGMTNIDNPWKSGTKMAPFDQEFHILLNVACGGIAYFPDDAQNPGGKPWKNDSPQASKDFWEGRNQWLPTWERNTDNYHMQVDYVRVWAL